MSSQNESGLPPEMFEKLLEQYRKALPERIKAIEEAINLVQQAPSKESLAHLRLLIHKMAGNAGSYGYPKVTEICRSWEKTLVERIESMQVDENLIQKLRDFVKQIQGEFQIHG